MPYNLANILFMLYWQTCVYSHVCAYTDITLTQKYRTASTQYVQIGKDVKSGTNTYTTYKVI